MEEEKKMTCSRKGGLKQTGVKFVPTKGSLIGGIQKDKKARIADAIDGLELVINGLTKQRDDKREGSQGNFALSSFRSFGQYCSIFLRKTVLGDFNKRETRLLDHEVLRSIGLQFDRLRKIPSSKRRIIEASHGLDIFGGYMQLTRRDDHTGKPQEVHRLPIPPQALKLSIEWPLPGAADWAGTPSLGVVWPVSADQLFQRSASPSLSCDDWLGQQVVLFDGRGITLKEIIQTVANFEGAHSIDTARLAVAEGTEASRSTRNPAPHILSAVTVCGIQYTHLIVIESALYLYEKLLDEGSIWRPGRDAFKVSLGVTGSPDQTKPSSPSWVRFQGSMMVSFSNEPRMSQHKISAVN